MTAINSRPILVTGAAGFIGAALCLRLLQRGDRVIGIDNLNTYYDPSLKQARLNGIEAATYPDGPRSAEIRVELPAGELTADFLERTLMRTPNGDYVPLADIVSVTQRAGFSSVQRQNGLRVVNVTGDIAGLENLALKSSWGMFLAVLLPGAVLLAFAEPFLGIVFSDDYRIAAVALQILVVGQCINVFFGSVGTLLNMTGFEKESSKGLAIAIIICTITYFS